ncbi:MAG TPA: hypothetical protein VJW76_14665, partial [Verrucomicrobiae bacterium]|nr:hypothetical protein [Verrucomicrobiae bacterium]
PTVLVADNLTNVVTTNLPPADGSYRYIVTAARRGAESPNSNVAIGVSDRTPPAAPTNLLAQVAAAGIQVSWQQPGGGESPARFHIYRNGTLIRTVTTATPVIDGPPRGVMNYTVAAADAAGNESLSAPAAIELFVGAVKNLQVLVNIGQAPALSWTSDDPTAVGFNVYRGGIRQNSSLLTATDFVDLLPSGTGVVQYAVRAVNGAGQESAPRLVDVYAVDLRLAANPLAGNNPITRYFDEYRATVSNLTAGASLPLEEVELRRTILGGEAAVRTKAVNSTIGEGNWLDQSLVFPGAGIVAVQSMRVRAVQETDLGGSLVIYQKIFDFPTVNLPANMVEIFANQLPLAGGLSAFEVRIFNRGGAPVDIVTTRNNGSQPGDIYVSVRNAQGQEVSRGEFNGTPSGTSFLGDGRGYVRVAAGASVLLTVPNVLVPDSLSSNALISFEAVVAKIYHRIGSSDQEESGPLNGAMSSALAVTDYYGTTQTDRTGYANEQPVIITGQAIHRTTGLPVPNAALKIGFASGGFRWYREVTTDSGGNYQYTYNPGPGLGGSLTLWAAHPLIFDALNQARISIYRLYATPSRGDVRMSKNDTIRFSIGLLNPGDVVLSNFTAVARAYVLSGTNRTEITNVTGSALLPADFALGFKQKRDVTLELAAAINAPDNVIVEFTFTSGEGAVAVLTANVTLLQAIPVLTVISPAVGYLETSVDRGTLLSRQVTVVNRGLRDLQGVELAPPTNVTWIAANLPRGADGKIHLPDIGVGQSNTFTVVFAPPANTPLGPTNDFFAITGTNTPAVFKVNVYPLVTSSQKGAVQFFVDNILSQDVPNATVRLRNTQLQIELPPVYTDSAALVTVTNLQEGQWSWQVSAPGHSANVGVIDVIPGQTVRVDTRLNKSVVTINFTVVPVPYTDKYEIKLEQTFETHVPLPVLVMTPAYREFINVTPGFEASYIVTAKNHGLIQMENLTITGQQTATASFTPLIDYVPVLLPQQEIEIPFKVVYWGTNAPSQQSNPLSDCLPGIPDFGYIGDFVAGLSAIANAEGRCIRDNSLLAIAGGVALGLRIYADITGLFAGVAEQVASYVGCVIGSLLANLGGGPFGGGGPGGPNQGTTQNYSQGGPQCFDPTTAVWMADGKQKPIGELRSGDSVRTGRGRNEVATVAQLFRRPVERLRCIRFEHRNGNGTGGIVRATDEHLFWVDGQGWTVANQLQVGDWLSTDTGGVVAVSSNEIDDNPGEVVTLQLRGDNAFYANGILVHDLCGPLPSTMPVIMKEARP